MLKRFCEVKNFRFHMAKPKEVPKKQKSVPTSAVKGVIKSTSRVHFFGICCKKALNRVLTHSTYWSFSALFCTDFGFVGTYFGFGI